MPMAHVWRRTEDNSMEFVLSTSLEIRRLNLGCQIYAESIFTHEAISPVPHLSLYKGWLNSFYFKPQNIAAERSFQINTEKRCKFPECGSSTHPNDDGEGVSTEMKVSNLLLACLHVLNMLILVLNDEACSNHTALCRDQHSPLSLHRQIRKRLKRESWVKRVRILDQGLFPIMLY